MTEMLPLILLAGGIATRMRPLTEKIPKSLIEVGGEPFLAHQLRLLRREGITRVVLSVSYFSEQIEAFAGDGRRFGLEIAYSVDTPIRLGTGGAIRKALPLLGDRFLVMYGDSWLDVPFAPIVDAFCANGMPALMTVFRNDGKWDRSNVQFENGRIVSYSKTKIVPQMRHIDWGLGALTPRPLLERPEGQPFDLADVYERLAERGQLAGFEVKARFYEIGSAEGLKETDALLRRSAHSLKAAERPSS